MNSLRFLLGAVLTGGTLLAQTEQPTTIVGATDTGAMRSAEELEQLLAPVALYPDALIAIILPATVAATDIVLAARHLRDFPGDRSQIEHRAWDESVKSLTHYPDVLKWMDENLPWTKQVGEAFALQPADVMQAIQRLRARARTNGTLVDTPQQQVIAEPDVIRIVPAQPEVIYVPRYEPEVLFVPQPIYYTTPVLSFAVGARVGSWLAYECDWRRKSIWVGDRHRSWRGHDWRRPVIPISPGFRHASPPAGVRQWCPPSRTVVHHRVLPRSHDIIRPSSVASPHQRTWSRSRSHSPRQSSTIVSRSTPTSVHVATRPTHFAQPPATQVPRTHSSPHSSTFSRSTSVVTRAVPSGNHSPARPSHWQHRESHHTRHVTHSPASRAVPAQPAVIASQPVVRRESRSHGHRSVTPPAATQQSTVSQPQSAPVNRTSSPHVGSRGGTSHSSRRGDYRLQR